MQDSSFISQQLINVEAVELLRGPQGTLYGGNAQGGMINIITRKASMETLSRTSVLYSNLGQQLDATAATKISENLYADISMRYVYNEGDIDHILGGEKEANDVDEQSLQACFNYLPEGIPLNVTLSISADKLDSHEEWYLSESEYDAATRQDIPELVRDVYTYSLDIGYDFGASMLNSITAFQDRSIDRKYAYGSWKENQNKFSQDCD